MGEAGDAITYRCTKTEVEKKFVEAGVLMYLLVKSFKALEGQKEYETLKRVFEDQYKVEQAEGEKKTIAIPKANEEIKATSVQNPHDVDCTYRNKAGTKTKGFSINITETCNAPESTQQTVPETAHETVSETSPENEPKTSDAPTLNLIVGVQVESASAADNVYTTAAIDAAQEIVPDKIEAAHADGAFHSPENQTFCEENDIDLIISGIGGKPSKYDLRFDDQNNLIVTNKETGTVLSAVLVNTRDPNAPKKWRVQDEDGKVLYFTEQDVKTCNLRKTIDERPPEVRNVRNNVEATVFQVGYHLDGDKSKYRGQEKHELWAVSRCLWINFRRILAYVGKIAGKDSAIGGAILNFCSKFLENLSAIVRRCFSRFQTA
jgi:hypothetical protein